jgi:uncharacterized delta-60 repeat protein
MEQTMIRRLTTITVMALALLAGAAPAWAAEGDLDTSFSGDGKATTPVGVGSSFEGAREVVLQPDGKIVAGGQAIGVGTGADFALARYDADGEMDPSFGTGGRVLTDMGGEFREEEVQAVAVQSDGKLVAAGTTRNNSDTDFAVARYNPSGTLDTSFSGDGRFTLDLGGKNEVGHDLAVQSDGKVVVAGTVAPVFQDQQRDFALIRLNPGGTLDETFDTDGKVFTNVVASGDEQILDLAFAADSQTDKKIVVAGDMSNNFAVARYNANGSLDTNTDADPTTHFDTDGIATTDFGSTDEAFGLVVAGDNKVTVAGVTSANFFDDGTDDFALARYNADGALDTTFSGDGKKTTDFGNTADAALGLALQADGEAVVAGRTGGRFALARYSEDRGSLDRAFGFDGRVTSVVSTGGSDVAEAVALQPDGKTVVAGQSPGSGSRNATSVVRYNRNGSLDPSFGSDGRVLTKLEATSEGKAVALQPDGKVLVAAVIRTGATRFGVFRYNPNGTLDTSFSGDGIQTTRFGILAEPEAIALQPNGKVLLAGRVNLSGGDDFAVVRYNANGSLDTTFDGDGRVSTPVGQRTDSATAMTLQGDKIVLAGTAFGSAGSDFAVVRYDANGSLDTTFDGDGRVTTPIGAPSTFAQAQALFAQPDGKLVVGGAVQNRFAFVRYASTGALDNTFGDDGILVDSGVDGTVQGLAPQQGGRFVAAGGQGLDFTLARYRPNGARDTTFSGDGLQSTDFGSFEEARAVVVGPDSRITVAGTFRNGGFNEDFALARYIGEATPPRVARVAPAEDATGIAPATNVIASFSEAMAPSSVSANTVRLFEVGSTTAIGASVSYDAATRRATLNPNANLKLGTRYKAVVTSGARDLAGNALDQDPALAGNQPKTWFFTVRN